MNATLPIASPSGWINRIAKGLGFLAPTAARAERTSEAVATAAIAKAAGQAGPVVILVDGFDAHGARVAELAAPLARQGFTTATVGVAATDAARAKLPRSVTRAKTRIPSSRSMAILRCHRTVNPALASLSAPTLHIH